jgi:hypothetical protein
VNEAQRQFYRRIFAWLFPVTLVFILLVWLAALGVMPHWVYWAAMIAWFGPLGPIIAWMNRRLAELASGDGTAAPPEAQGPGVGRPESPQEWSAGGWFGAQIGASAWLLITALVLAAHDRTVAGLVLGIFLLANILGTTLWLRRVAMGRYKALQILIAIVCAASLAATFVIEQAGLWPLVNDFSRKFGGIGLPAGAIYLLILAMFAALAAIFHLRFSGSRDPGG